jgi:hypothetical protein
MRPPAAAAPYPYPMMRPHASPMRHVAAMRPHAAPRGALCAGVFRRDPRPQEPQGACGPGLRGGCIPSPSPWKRRGHGPHPHPRRRRPLPLRLAAWELASPLPLPLPPFPPHASAFAIRRPPPPVPSFKKLWFLIGPQRPSHLWHILTLIPIVMLYYYSSLSLSKL